MAGRRLHGHRVWQSITAMIESQGYLHHHLDGLLISTNNSERESSGVTGIHEFLHFVAHFFRLQIDQSKLHHGTNARRL